MNTNNLPSVVSKDYPLHSYNWGHNCEAAVFVDDKDLSIKLESMPGSTEEELHFHSQAQQFFYILKGTAAFEIEEVILLLHPGEGLHIKPDQKHRIMNKEEQALEFLICSQPSTNNDRQNLV